MKGLTIQLRQNEIYGQINNKFCSHSRLKDLNHDADNE